MDDSTHGDASVELGGWYCLCGLFDNGYFGRPILDLLWWIRR